jgi:hypothetical protein
MIENCKALIKNPVMYCPQNQVTKVCSPLIIASVTYLNLC